MFLPARGAPRCSVWVERGGPVPRTPWDSSLWKLPAGSCRRPLPTAADRITRCGLMTYRTTFETITGLTHGEHQAICPVAGRWIDPHQTSRMQTSTTLETSPAQSVGLSVAGTRSVAEQPGCKGGSIGRAAAGSARSTQFSRFAPPVHGRCFERSQTNTEFGRNPGGRSVSYWLYRDGQFCCSPRFYRS